MSASEAAVARVMEVLGCSQNRNPFQHGVPRRAVTCVEHHRAMMVFGGTISGRIAVWTDRGCPVAIAAADATWPTAQAVALREAAEAWYAAPGPLPGNAWRWLNERADRAEQGEP